jgi:molecular chaperone DnaJ
MAQSHLRDPFALLGLERLASDQDVKRAYRKLARENHPDHNPGDVRALQRFQDISWAFEQIGKPDKRRAWLESVRQQQEQQTATEFASFFNAKAGRQPRRGDDVYAELTLSFDRAFKGEMAEVAVKMIATCTDCGGSGAAPGSTPIRCYACGGAGMHQVGRVSQVCSICGGSGVLSSAKCDRCTGHGQVEQTRKHKIQVPPGVLDGSVLRLRGKGAQGWEEAGDLVITVQVETSTLYERLDGGADLLLKVPVTYGEACLGAEIRIPTPEGNGRTVLLKLTPGTSSGRLLRVKGRGMPLLGQNGRGDLYAQIMVQVPKQLTEQQKILLSQLQAYDKGDNPRRALFEGDAS